MFWHVGLLGRLFVLNVNDCFHSNQLIHLWLPIARFGMPDECAGIVSFLSSDDASYITGETIPVSGGMTSRL